LSRHFLGIVKRSEISLRWASSGFGEVNEKPTNALIIQCIGTAYSPTCFGTLKCHHQGVKHDLAEIGAQCRGYVPQQDHV
jgi:hypothetical protein